MDQKPFPLETVYLYHQQTKHRFERYAEGPGFLDWSNQPNPFCRYKGAQLFPLPLGSKRDALSSSPKYGDLFYHELPPQPVTLQAIADFFRSSLALSAWKQAGDSRWALRVNPSSGNLHPTEAYLLSGPIAGLSTTANLFHYTALEHGLEKRCELPKNLWDSLSENFPADVFFIGFSSIYWRESWKYGARAFRYCHLDLGHALAAVSLAASMMGWRCRLLNELSKKQLRDILGLDDNDLPGTEQPDCLLAISAEQPDKKAVLPEEAIAQMRMLKKHGVASPLSEAIVPWPIIDAVCQACEKPITNSCSLDENDESIKRPRSSLDHPAQQIIQQRRSALAMDGETSMQKEQFYLLLTRLLLKHVDIPYDVLGREPQVNLLFFIHRVTGLAPGLYLLHRENGSLEDLKSHLSENFAWRKPDDCPEVTPLYQLLDGDAKQIAREFSCGQDIAADGCFCIAMLARFEEPLLQQGAWVYPQLYWECGLIGQVLYLEAENIGLRATGIGCFFDDPVHELLGLGDQSYQVLYHFTVGGFVEDTRLLSLPGYDESSVNVTTKRKRR